MSNRYYTLIVVPEKSASVRRLIIPAWLVRGSAVVLFFTVIFGLILLLDYWYFLNQIGENKSLKIENRRIRQQVQIYKNKVVTLESTMNRVQNFAVRLRLITNIEDKDGLVQTLNRHLPDASVNVVFDSPELGGDTETGSGVTAGASTGDLYMSGDSDLKLERSRLNEEFAQLNDKSLLLEQNLQDLYELLADQKAFLLALPTRKPALGDYTSGFGVRRSPFGDKIKMHEGLDIANYSGTTILATAKGVVTHAAVKPGYGKTVIIDHGYGLETWYAHARQIMVNVGDKIKRGERIALMGSSGQSTGSHLHYEVRVHSIPHDPLTYILEN
jgi:murein DD-endopeptidase MepM/ murein hydrolase activator NlpD